MKGFFKFIVVLCTILLALYGLYTLLKKYGNRLGLECFDEDDELLCEDGGCCFVDKVKSAANKEIDKIR